MPDDLPSILPVYEAAREFMRQNGNATQWGDHFPPQELLEQDVKEERLYVVEEDGNIHASFVFVLGEDPHYRIIDNGKWLSDTPYGTIHRVASDGSLSGVFDEMVKFCRKQIAHLRIDTHERNLVMRHLIQKNGFVQCGTIYVRDGSPRIAFEWMESRNTKNENGEM